MTSLEVDVAKLREICRKDFLINKEPVQCIIMTTKNLIEGEIHKRVTYRVLDEINAASKFIAVTNARIFSGQSNKMMEAEFMALRADQIVWVKPSISDAEQV
ncbi:MAG: hypothetical protein PVI78_08535 [Anaerolineales bacterium]|jgi:hypothetical protein